MARTKMFTKRMKKIIYFLPAVLYYGLIFFLSSRSYDVEMDIPFIDKGLHCLEFAILGFLLSLGYFLSLNVSLKWKAALTISSGILLGALDEWHQYFVPQRSTEFLDLMADSLGIILGMLVFIFFARKALKL